MSVNLGELRARLTAESSQMKQEIRAVKKEFAELGQQGQKASGGVKQLESALDRFGDSAGEVGKLTAQLDNINARIDIQRKKLAELRQSYDNTFNDAQKMKIQEEILRTEASIMRLMKQSDETAQKIWKLEDSAEDAADGLKDLKNQSVGAADGLDEVDKGAKKSTDSLRGMESVLTAIGSAIATKKIVDVVKTTANEATKLDNSLRGLDSVAKSFGHSMDAARDSAKSLADDGLAPVSTYSTALKDLLSTGLGMEEANHLLQVFKDRAAFGKAESISFGQAIQNLGQAFKTESSTLGDMSGMTENFSLILEEGARQLGKTVDELTQAERAQAKYLGIVQLSEPFIGDAVKLTDSFSGRQAALNAKWQEAQEVLGEAYIPMLDEIMEKVTPLIMDFTKWASENKEVVAGITAATAAMSAMIGVVTALTVALRLLQAASPVGWIMTGITLLGTLVGGVMTYNAAVEAVTESVWKFAQSQDELNKKLAESPLNRTTDDVRKLEHDMNKINELMARRGELMDEINKKQAEINEKAAKGHYDITGGRDLSKLQKELNEINESLSDLGIDTPDKAPEVLAEMNKQIEGAIPALLELKRAEGAEIAVKVDHIDKVSQLRDRYAELNKVEKLNEVQKAELASVVEQLKREYPSLIAYLDEENRWHIKNIEDIDLKIQAEKDFVEQSAEGMRTYLENLKNMTTGQIAEIDKQIAKLEELAAMYKETDDGWIEGTPDVIKNLSLGRVLGPRTNDELRKQYEERNRLIMSNNEIDKAISNITYGNFDEFKIRPPDLGGGTSAGGKSPEQLATDLRRQNFQADLATIRFRTEMYEWSKEQQIMALEELQQKHKRHLSDTVEDERNVMLQIKRLNDDIAAERVANDAKARKEQFDHSVNWIEREKYYKRLSLEEELEAWQRVANRYAKGTDEREKAERELFRVEQELNRERIKEVEEVTKAREQSVKDMTSKTIKSIRDMRKAELDAINERKREIEKAYQEEAKLRDQNKRAALDAIDAEKRAIDDMYRSTVESLDEEKYVKERKEIVDEMEKYRFAASKKGQDRFRELENRLQNLDEQKQRRDLQNERDEKLRALDDQRRDLERHYDNLRTVKDLEKERDLQLLDEQRKAVEGYYKDVETIFSESADNIEAIETAMQDTRLFALQATNEAMLAEMRNYVSEYQRIMSSMGSAPADDVSIMSQMQSNAIRWHAASETERKQLEAQNERLGAQLGAYKEKGVWYKDGKRLFHTGGTGDFNFRFADRLMPDEIEAIIKRTEFVFQPKQLASLLEYPRAAGDGGGITNIYNAPLTEVKEMHVRDDQDAEIISRDLFNQQQRATRMARGSPG